MRYADALTTERRLELPRPREDRSHAAPLLARLRARSIDQDLAAGADAWLTPVHAARARQLTSDRTRRTLARTLEQIVEHADAAPTRGYAARVHPPRALVHQARPMLLTLSARLRNGAPVDPRAVAALRDLVCDGTGELYVPSDPRSLQRRLRTIAAWLEVRN
jgi:hypothetical protein